MLQLVLLWSYSYHRFFLWIIIGFSWFNFYSTQIRNNIVESLFCISGASAEHEDDSKGKLIVEIKIGLLLELYRYSSD